jgi:hypothetical protein
MRADAILTDAHAPVASEDLVTRLLVTWQNSDTRLYEAVAVLEATDGGYEFAYLRRVERVPGFVPFLGFSEITRRYRSERLFSLFSERVLDPSRPDRPGWLNALALGQVARPMEILARSGGHRPGDSIEVVPEPQVDTTGRTTCDFMVHGVRYQAGASERISLLAEGERLRLVEQPNNPANRRALLVTDKESHPLGWVPDPLLDYVHTVRSQGNPVVTVVRANGPEIGYHLRLLVHLDGKVAPGYRAFSGPEWETLA